MKARQRPRKSLRTILIFWFLVFSVAPLAVITVYSLYKYEKSIDQELSQRLLGNAREISVILNDFQTSLASEARAMAGDHALGYFLSTNKTAQARDLVKRYLKGSVAHRAWVFNNDGRLEIALYKDDRGEIQRRENLENVVELTDSFVRSMNDRDELALLDISTETGNKSRRGGRLELTFYSKIKINSGRLVGFLEEVISLDEFVLTNFRNRLNAEIFFFQRGKPGIVATHEDLAMYKTEVFEPHLKDNEFFELNIREVPYRFMLRELKWGESRVVLGLGASKIAARSVLKNVNIAFFSLVGGIVFLLVFLTLITSRILLRPIYQVLSAIERSDFDKGLVELPANNETELGLVAESFNDLSRRTYESQKALKDKVGELEKANIEIRETQAKLVHTAKMASLGQLVAGVAHELNNPIGFIYSNMAHLRDYSDKLLHLVSIAKDNPKALDKEIAKADLDYIREDLPKLITSCEEGARRTRDIVLGLRNFSRLDEAQIKEVDLHEGLENTLHLLQGELKNRIQVIKKFGKIPKVTCHPSQLNQVFMNVLANAAHAIDGEGTVTISTKPLEGERVEISIRDTGKGMNKQTLEKIFDPFFTTKSLGRGTGLGLSISYGVIQKHGGEILVSSEVGQGTEFKIILPVNGVS